MEAEAEPEPVTLLVKSPNQRHRDLELSGDRGWSVGRLKAHLSLVYPERPVSRPPPSPPCGPPGMPRPPPLSQQLLPPPVSPDRGCSPCHLPQGRGLPSLPHLRGHPVSRPGSCHFLVPAAIAPPSKGLPSPAPSPPAPPAQTPAPRSGL